MRRRSLRRNGQRSGRPAGGAIGPGLDQPRDFGPCLQPAGLVFLAPAIIEAFTSLERQLASPDGDTRASKPVRSVPRWR